MLIIEKLFVTRSDIPQTEGTPVAPGTVDLWKYQAVSHEAGEPKSLEKGRNGAQTS